MHRTSRSDAGSQPIVHGEGQEMVQVGPRELRSIFLVSQKDMDPMYGLYSRGQARTRILI